MKRNLQRPRCFVAFFFLLISSSYAMANTPRENAKQALPAIHQRQSVPLHVSNTKTLTLTAPADITVGTDAWLYFASGVDLGQPTVSAADNRAEISISNDAPASFPIGTTVVTWKATDGAGNTATAVQRVTVEDREKPVIFRRYEIAVVNDPGKCGAVVQLMTPEYYDNSGGAVTFTNDAPQFFEVGSRLITWTATDQYGNSDTSTQLITVIDNELPTISVADVSVNAAAGKSSAVVNLGIPVTGDNCGVVSVENNAPAQFPIGTTLVYWTVTDKVGYTNIAVQKVTVSDNEKPKIVAPAALTFPNTPGRCGYEGTIAPPAVSDNTGIASITSNAPTVFPTGTTVITWTATDVNGNQSTITQSVTVKDTEAPVFISVPQNLITGCDGVPPAVTPAVRDNCTASPTVTFTQTSTQSANTSSTGRYNYTITRIWTARDAAGNTSNVRQVITVQDKTGPLIAVPSDITRANDPNTCGAKVSFAASAVDNCGSPVNLSYSKTSGSLFATGTTQVTVIARDISGNVSTKTFYVTVVDTQRPSVKAPSSVSVNTGGTSVPRSAVNLGNPAASDNCGIGSITNNAPASFPLGVTSIKWTVTDVNNNVTVATQTVTVTSSTKRRNEVGPVALNTGIMKETVATEGLSIGVAPNPSSSFFTIRVQGRPVIPVDLRVLDVQGRAVEVKTKLAVNSTVQVGSNYPPGAYFAEFIQGNERKVIQLVKIR